MKKIFAMLAVLAVVLMGMTAFATPAQAEGFSTDPENPTLVTEVPQGFEVYGDSQTTTADDGCTTTTTQEYSRLLTPGTEGVFGDWTEWQVTQSHLLSEPTVPANTNTHEWQVLGPESVGNDDAVEAQHYSLKGKAKTEKDGIPPTPAENPDIWQANTHKEPKGHYGHMYKPDGSLYVEGDSGLHYASHESNGKRDWFYFEPGHAETFHDEWSVQERTRTFTPGADSVSEYVYTVTQTDDCPIVPPECETGCTPHPQHHSHPPKHHNTVTHKHTETPAAVPTVIESGLAGTQTVPESANNAGWLVALGVGIMLLGVAALRRKN